MTAIKTLETKIAVLPIESLKPWKGQRAALPAHVAQIKANFDPLKLGVITVVEDVDGVYRVIDGQHRVAALRELAPDCKVRCEVLPCVDDAAQAETFLGVNEGRRRLHAIDRYRAQLLAKEPVAVAIAAACKAAGVSVSKHSGSRNVQAVAALYAVQRASNLEATLRIARQWANDSEDCLAYEGSNLKAVSAFIQHYPEFVPETLMARLAKTPPVKLIERFKRDIKMGVPSRQAYVERMLEIYNHGARKRLPAKPFMI